MESFGGAVSSVPGSLAEMVCRVVPGERRVVGVLIDERHDAGGARPGFVNLCVFAVDDAGDRKSVV